MTNSEKILEAIEYAAEEEIEWHSLFKSKASALKILRLAANETPEEEQIAQLIAYTEYDGFLDYYSVQDTYVNILNWLEEELNGMDAN